MLKRIHNLSNRDLSKQTVNNNIIYLETINTIGVACDYSFKCEKIWKKFMPFSY